MLRAGGKNVWKALQSGYAQATRGQAERLAHAVAQHDIKVAGHPSSHAPQASCHLHFTAKTPCVHNLPSHKRTC